jgi:hypothetical protein
LTAGSEEGNLPRGLSAGLGDISVPPGPKPDEQPVPTIEQRVSALEQRPSKGESAFTKWAAIVAITLGVFSLPTTINDFGARFWPTPKVRLEPGDVVTLISEPNDIRLRFNLAVVNDGSANGIVTAISTYLGPDSGVAAVNTSVRVECANASGQLIEPPFAVTNGLAVALSCVLRFDKRLRDRFLAVGSRRLDVRLATSRGEAEAVAFCFPLSAETISELSSQPVGVPLDFKYPDCNGG